MKRSTTTSSACAAPCRSGPTARAGSCIPATWPACPPGVLHAYQFHGHYSQFMGPIAPAGWDRFFDFTGSPYAGPAYPQVDNSPPPFAKFGAAEAKFAMKYFPEEPYAEASTGPDDDAARRGQAVLRARGRGTAPCPVRPGRLPAHDGRRKRRATRDDGHRGPAGPGHPCARARAHATRRSTASTGGCS